MRKSNIFVYSLDNKVVFPYTEYQTSIIFEDFISKRYDDLIGFITETNYSPLDLSKSKTPTLYGTLMKINSSFCSLINEKIESNNYNLEGLMFARFKVITMKQHQTGYLADIEILNDFIDAEVEDTVRNSQQYQQLINKILQYQYELGNCEIQINDYVDKIRRERRVNKVVFMMASRLDLRIQDAYELLQAEGPMERIGLLVRFIEYKINRLRVGRMGNGGYLPKL